MGLNQIPLPHYMHRHRITGRREHKMDTALEGELAY